MGAPGCCRLQRSPRRRRCSCRGRRSGGIRSTSAPAQAWRPTPTTICCRARAGCPGSSWTGGRRPATPAATRARTRRGPRRRTARRRRVVVDGAVDDDRVQRRDLPRARGARRRGARLSASAPSQPPLHSSPPARTVERLVRAAVDRFLHVAVHLAVIALDLVLVERGGQLAALVRPLEREPRREREDRRRDRGGEAGEQRLLLRALVRAEEEEDAGRVRHEVGREAVQHLQPRVHGVAGRDVPDAQHRRVDPRVQHQLLDEREAHRRREPPARRRARVERAHVAAVRQQRAREIYDEDDGAGQRRPPRPRRLHQRPVELTKRRAESIEDAVVGAGARRR